MNISNHPSTEQNGPGGTGINWEEHYVKSQTRARLMEQITSASIDCAVALNLNEEVIYWNVACADLMNIAANDVMGKPLVRFFPALAMGTEIRNAFRQVKQGRKVFVPASCNAWLPGHFEIHLVLLKTQEGQVDGILLIAHDVAHRVKAEQELKALNNKLMEKYAELERANAELATFTHITSHDLEKPLRNIYSSLEKVVMTEGSHLTAKGRGVIRKVQSTAQRLGLLADSLSTFSELQHELATTVDLSAVVQEAVAKVQPQIRERQAKVEVAELPGIKGDHAQLVTLFQQLLSNALKFQRGEVAPEISITAKQVDPEEAGLPSWMTEPEYWEVSVRDNGIGVDPADRTRIFNLFEKGAQAERYPGAGLGLALVRKIAVNHRGTALVGDQMGGGSIFHCYFPATVPGPSAAS